MTATVFPSYRARYLPGMTLRQIAALPDKTTAPVIVATGAIEQHGPHLPVAVDSFLAQVWLHGALPLLPPDASVYVAPAITIGKSNEHTGFPGTLFISKDTLRAQLWAIARQIHAWGFKNLVILHTHGGNIAVTVYTLREISAALGLRCGALAPKVDMPVPLQESTFGYHANTAETALLLATLPQYVDMSKAVADYCGRVETMGNLRPERAPATMAWISADLSKTGIMGDAAVATPELGRRWVEVQTAATAAAIVEVCRAARAG